MAKTAFGVTYDGPALVDGRMPVRELAPALLALGELFSEASAIAYPERPPVALDIKATQEGSFDVQLILEGPWDELVDMFSSDPVTAIINLKELIVGSGIGLFWIIKKLRGRRVVDEQPAPEPGHTRITLDDGTTIDVPAGTAALYRSTQARQHARQVVAPLERDGVDIVEFREARDVTIRIETDDLPAFDPPAAEAEPLGEDELTMVVSIAAVAFKEKNKWRVSDGMGTVWATMEDEEFLSRVDRGLEAFRKGDMLRCRVRMTQSRDDEGLHTEFTILEVLEHIPRAQQMELEPGEPDEPPG